VPLQCYRTEGNIFSLSVKICLVQKRTSVIRVFEWLESDNRYILHNHLCNYLQILASQVQRYRTERQILPVNRMRRVLFLLLAFALIASASKGLASTDCERWLAEYKNELAHKVSVQRALAARQRARSYAKRKVAHLIAPAVSPKPHPTRVSSTRPHLTPAQMLKRFDLLCGDLPVEASNQVLDARMAPDEFISEMSMGGPVDTEVLPAADTLLASEDLPPYVPAESSLGTPSGQPFWPVYGPIPTSSGFGAPTSTPSVPVLPPVAPIPEPSSVLLVLTGTLGTAGSVWKRRRCA